MIKADDEEEEEEWKIRDLQSPIFLFQNRNEGEKYSSGCYRELGQQIHKYNGINAEEEEEEE